MSRAWRRPTLRSNTAVATIFGAVVLTAAPLAATASTEADSLSPRQFMLSRMIMRDGAEHHSCPGPWWSSASTCTANGRGTAHVTDVTAHTGVWSYRLPTQPPSGWNGVDDIAIHTAKFAAYSPKLERLQYPTSRSGGVVRYSAWFYIESGFDDVVDPTRSVNPWHIQMQWKGSKPFYVPENPKLAWGFQTVRESGYDTLQVTLTIREATPGTCRWSFDFFTRASSLHLPALAVPRHEWVKITTEVRFHESLGYVRIWQGETPAPVIDVSGINTLTQLVAPNSPYVAYLPAGEPSCQDLSDPNNVRTYFRTKTQSFEWGITNYLSTRSYMSAYRTATDNHVVLTDDILVETD